MNKKQGNLYQTSGEFLHASEVADNADFRERQRDVTTITHEAFRN